MRIEIKATNLEINDPLREYAMQKIGDVGKFLQRWELEGELTAWLELERTTSHHHKGEVYRAEVNIELPGQIIRAENIDRDIRVAIDKVKHILKQQIVKYNEMAPRQ